MMKMSAQLTVRFDPKYFGQAEAIAMAETRVTGLKVTAADIIRRALSEYVEKAMEAQTNVGADKH